MNRITLLPFALPELGVEELEQVKDVLASGWITTGPKARQFEAEFARYVGAKYAVSVNSCTAAMHLSLEAVGLQPGDFVLTTPYTFAATAEVVRYFNATPVFVDVERDTLNIDPRSLAATIEDLERCLATSAKPQTAGVARALGQSASGRGVAKAIIPVHIAGHSCDTDAIVSIAAEHALAVIEDAAHACSASFKGRRIGGPIGGGLPWAACFSFYATKTIATGEGGMITTDCEEWADRFRIMSLHGISKDAWKRYTAEGNWYYEIMAPGYKYNMPDILAAIGLAQLKKVDVMRQRREEIARRYHEGFAAISGIELPTVRQDIGHAWHLYMIRLEKGALRIGRDQFIQNLKQRNVSASVHFIPLHLHPYYKNTYGYEQEDFPIALSEYNREISLPIYSKMTDADVTDVIDAVVDVVHESRAESYASARH